MLLVHSPDLSELRIDGIYRGFQLWVIRRLLFARWPSLRVLSIGNLPSQERPSDFADTASFIQAHPALEKVVFSGGLSGASLSTFPITSLSRLHSFCGRIHQLKGVAHLSSLRELRLTDYFSPSTASFVEILQFFPSVASLAVCVNFLDALNRVTSEGFFVRLLTACPRLSHVEISSTSSFPLV